MSSAGSWRSSWRASTRRLRPCSWPCSALHKLAAPARADCSQKHAHCFELRLSRYLKVELAREYKEAAPFKLIMQHSAPTCTSTLAVYSQRQAAKSKMGSAGFWRRSWRASTRRLRPLRWPCCSTGATRPPPAWQARTPSWQPCRTWPPSDKQVHWCASRLCHEQPFARSKCSLPGQ